MASPTPHCTTPMCGPPLAHRGCVPRSRQREHGAFSVLFSLLLLVMLGFCGLAVDTAMMYNRRAETHGIAAAIAMAAARELDGTTAGIDSALAKAAETAGRLKYRYNRSFAWSSSAITFSNTPAAGA